MKTVSVIVPCYNEEEAAPIFYREFLKRTAEMDCQWEFWFVDDGSKDGTLAEFRALRAQDERVHFISFSRNFGKESAMYAGLEAATGDYVAIMDVDLQDPPELLPGMLQSIEKEGYAVQPDAQAAAVRRFQNRLNVQRLTVVLRLYPGIGGFDRHGLTFALQSVQNLWPALQQLQRGSGIADGGAGHAHQRPPLGHPKHISGRKGIAILHQGIQAAKAVRHGQ